MRRQLHIWGCLLVLGSLLVTGCAPAVPLATKPPTPTPAATPTRPLVLTSLAFDDGSTIPTKYTYNMPEQCSGENFSPPLAWTGVPVGTQGFAILMVDPDAGNWVHWVQFNIPPDTTSLSEVVGGPNIGVKGVNDFGELGYGGPCPPSGTHNYIFSLYALDTTLSLSQGATKAQVDAVMTSHILSQGQLTGRRSRG